ncbi:hypothetical protein V6N13_020798 [Hibiscus sabdariffa]
MQLRVKEKRRELELVQLEVLAGNHSLLEQEQILHADMKDLFVAEEGFFRQKTRVIWIQEDDLNTRCFHFVNIPGAKDENATGCSISILRELVGTFSEKAKLVLRKRVTREEICSSILSMNPDKALGPDDYTAHFFKAA